MIRTPLSPTWQKLAQTKPLLATMLNKWEAMGRCAHHYPKLQTVSLNGFPPISEREAIRKIREFLL